MANHSSLASQVALIVKNPSVSAGDIRETGSIPGSGRSPGGGYCNPLQYSCLENPMDRGTQRAAVHGVIKSWTWLKQLSTGRSEKAGATGSTSDQRAQREESHCRPGTQL